MSRDTDARSFDSAADSYQRSRPGYPAEAVGWMVPTDAHDVLDLGAGTGKLTLPLLAPGRRVIAVEPLPGMRAALAEAVPTAQVLAGSAERIPLPDAALDAVVVGQAWHWFDHDAATAEIARVLRPGGVLGLVWNFADERVGWVGEVWRMMHEAGGDRAYEGMRGEDLDPNLGEDFEPAQTAMFSHHHVLDAAALLDLVRSRSYVIALSAARRAALLDDIAAVLHREPATAGGAFGLPYRTRCWRAVRRLNRPA